MLVWTGVATDARVLREARTLVAAGHTVHVIGRAVPSGFEPPDGVTVESVGRPPLAQERARRLNRAERLVRWSLLPEHVSRRLAAWQRAAFPLALAAAGRDGVPDVVHAHDYTALPVGAALAREWRRPLVYDTHEYWVGRPVEGRPAPARRRSEAREEASLGREAAAVITVGAGVARALREDHPEWPAISVVRNTFPHQASAAVSSPPTGLVYAGRLARDRELEVVSAASHLVDLPVTLMGPSDAEWLSTFDPGRATVAPSEPLDRVGVRLQAAGASLVTHSDRWANHRLALPNKLFHAVSLGVPVVATDVGELAGAVREHDLGTLYRPGDPQSLARAVRDLVDRHEHYRAAVDAAAPLLSWGHDERVLLDVYDAVATR
jgi:glycosyltransferase involved in cell wall biosynthesis